MEHRELVQRLAKPGRHILQELTPQGVHLWHMASCICGEAGELFDAIKKYVIYNGHLDGENIIEELGDLEFYMEGLRQSLGIRRETTLHANMKKLLTRYPEAGYTDQRANDRADKLTSSIDKQLDWEQQPPQG